MATRKRRRQKKDYEQFSKRLSKWVLIFWAAYRIFTLAVAIARPEITTGLATLTHGVDDAAMCVVISYTVNSASEKMAIQYFAAKVKEREADEDEEEDTDEKKERDNG